jgi:hypothetical protein
MHEKFRPYIGLPTEPERLQALRDFLHWIYFSYTSPSQFFRDFHVMLNGLRVSDAVKGGRPEVDALVGTLQSLGQGQEFQADLRGTLEAMLPAATIGTMFPPPPMRALVVREVSSEERTYAWVYASAGDTKDGPWESLRRVCVSQLLAFLDGLNTAALVRCAECQHYTVRRHPKGKEYCSQQCRWRAAAATRRATLKQRQTIKSKEKSRARKGRKERG